MLRNIRRTIAAGMLAIASMVVSAQEVIAESGPVLTELNGVQSDGNTPPPYSQSFSAAIGASISRIVWWGFHGAFSEGADAFVVQLNDVLQAGTLSVADEPSFSQGTLSRYTFDLASSYLVGSSANQLAISNDSVDVEWYWQRAAGADGQPLPGDEPNYPVSYRVEGVTVAAPIPEADAAAMFVLGLAFVGAAVGRARRRRAAED